MRQSCPRPAMESERWKRAKQIFADAIEREPAERQSFVSRECAGDEELERELLSLLRHHEKPDTLLGETRLCAGPWLNQACSPVLSEGSIFGKYTIIRLLGHGGMGEVYFAEDTTLRRKVALKLLPSWFSCDRRWVARFQQEALAASRLNHPNVPVVYEAAEIEGRHSIATEFVEGITLAQRIARGPIAWRDAISIVIPVGYALAAAHACGIVHRDVKPGNILIRQDGCVKLVDFGIATLAELTLGGEVPPELITAHGTVIGTPAYMSPEQSAGIPVDNRTDIWSLAVVLYEMISGYRPRDRIDVSDLPSAVPAPVRSALARALESNRENRYSAVGEFTRDLESAVSPTHRRSSSIAPGRRFWVAAVLLVLLLGTWEWQILRRRYKRDDLFQVGNIRKLTANGKVVEVAISRDSRYILYSVEESGRQTLRLLEVATGADQRRMGPSAAAYTKITFAPDGNSFYYLEDRHKDVRTLYRAPLVEGAPVRLIEDVDSPVAFSPDGRQIEFERGNPEGRESSLFIAATDGSGVRRIATRPYSRSFLSSGATWSGDGKSVITGAYDEQRRAILLEVAVADGKQRQLGPSVWRAIGRISSISSGRVLIFAASELNAANPQLYQYPINGRQVSSITADVATYLMANASENNIVAVQRDRLSSIWTVSTGATPRRISPSPRRYFQIAWMPDGTLVSHTGVGPEMNIWRIYTDGPMRQITNGRYLDWDTAVSRDGTRLAFLSNRGGGRHLWTSNEEGQFLRQLTSGAGADFSPSFTPDGWIVYDETVSGTPVIFKIRPDGGAPVRVVPGPSRNPVVSPTGEYLACELNEGGNGWRRTIINLRTGQAVVRLPEIPVNSPVRWTEDGKALAYIATKDGISNIAVEAFASPSERLLTNFQEETIFSFDLSQSSGQLALVRGIEASDIVLFENPR